MFKKGDVVVYGVHGRCEVTGVETKTINKEKLKFYELRPVVTTPNMKADRRFLIPVETAREAGLREELSAEDIPHILEIIQSPEYYFPLNSSWVDRNKVIELSIRTQGAEGLAKAVSHLYAYHEKNILPDPAATKTYQNLFRLLVREISIATAASVKDTEVLVTKTLSKKPLLDH